MNSAPSIQAMNSVAAIRARLGVTQQAFGEGIGCSQGNVHFYERGQAMPPDVAGRLIEYARTLGHSITFDDIYADRLPDAAEMAAKA